MNALSSRNRLTSAGLLIAFQRKGVIAALIHNLASDRALAVERVRCDDRALQRQKFEKFRNGRDLVGFAIHGELAKHKPLIGRQRMRFARCAL